MFTNYVEAARRKRAAEPDFPYYLPPGKPTPEQWIAFWQARALIAEARLKALRQQQPTTTTKRKKQ